MGRGKDLLLRRSEQAPSAARLVPVPKRVARHHVYVIELDRAVLDHAKFRAVNPGHDPRKPPLYVGMTGLDPATRFERHKYGVKDNRYVREESLRRRRDEDSERKSVRHKSGGRLLTLRVDDVVKHR